MSEDYKKDYKSLRKIIDKNGDINTNGIKDLAHHCVAFANTQGGELIIGIEDKDNKPPVGQIIDPNLINILIRSYTKNLQDYSEIYDFPLNYNTINNICNSTKHYIEFIDTLYYVYNDSSNIIYNNAFYKTT